MKLSRRVGDDTVRTFQKTESTRLAIGRNEENERVLIFEKPFPKGVSELPSTWQENDLLICRLTPELAAFIRKLPGAPRAVVPPKDGVSFGAGDRLCGYGTRAHTLALRAFPNVFPVFAQQSVRENARLQRTAQGVMDDTLWALIESGWNGPWAGDADHQKTPEDVTEFLNAGFTLVTCDPGEHVVAIDESQVPTLDHIDWDTLETKPADFARTFVEETLWVEAHWGKTITDLDFVRSLSKYGNAVAHAKRMYRHARSVSQGKVAFELSVDETNSPTTFADHRLIQRLCEKLKIELWSLAPRFVGAFNKGVEYKPDLEAFQADLRLHAFLARQGNYKLSIHSGSDKFSIYPLLAENCSALHLKTSGTSYLAALQVVAACDPWLFMELFLFARKLYPEASQTYHVDAELDAVDNAALDRLRREEYPLLVLGYHGRQILHVAFGQILGTYGERIFKVLEENEAYHQDLLSMHIKRHLRPFKDRRA